MKTTQQDSDWMRAAFDEAVRGMNNNEGGPFGAVVVMDGKVIGKGNNRVTSLNDPTAHAEVTAIRDACKRMKRFHLPEAVIYTTCEPCPMCLSAIYWANIKTIYYCSTRRDAKAIGFDDKYIYDEVKKPLKERDVPCVKLLIPEGPELFTKWTTKTDKTRY